MLRSVQAARGVAALLVLLFHLGGAVAAYFHTDAFRVPFGHAGVDFFFVLSGYIIFTAHRGDIGRPSRLWRYTRKRLVRIYPAYWVAFLLALAGALAVRSYDPVVIAKALLLVPLADPPVITVAWSLQYEMVFYLLFGLLIVSPWVAAIGLVLLAATVPLLASAYMALFALGIGCALLERSAVPVHAATALGLGVAGFGVAAAIETATGLWHPFAYGAASAVALFGLVRLERAGVVIGGGAAAQLLGNASYSLYLVHYPVISATCKALALVGAPGIVAVLTAPVASIAAALALHYAVERPLMQGRSRRTPLPPGSAAPGRQASR